MKEDKKLTEVEKALLSLTMLGNVLVGVGVSAILGIAAGIGPLRGGLLGLTLFVALPMMLVITLKRRPKLGRWISWGIAIPCIVIFTIWLLREENWYGLLAFLSILTVTTAIAAVQSLKSACVTKD